MPTIPTEAAKIACKVSGELDTEDGETACFSGACYASWKEVDEVVTIFERGCFDYYEAHIGKNCCETCTPFATTKMNRDTVVTEIHHMCCCTQNLCNEIVQSGNFTDANIGSESSGPTATTVISNSRVEFAIIPVVAICIIALVVYCGRKYLPVVVKCMKPTGQLYTGSLSMKTPQAAEQCVEVTVAATIHQGKYGKVSLGKIEKESRLVCIKEFNISTAQGKKLFRCEKHCHILLQQCNHRNIVKYLTAAEKNRPDPKIVLEYYPQGSLRQFLMQHIVDLKTCVGILNDITGAVSFLQNPGVSQLPQGVAHRDISSGNFLVKCDTTVVISDFGFSVPFKEIGENQRVVADLTAAGTPNYMAPEILRGTIDLNNFVSALKQADVYSTALVMWEVINRCYAFYDSRSDIPEATIPYQMEMKGGNDLYHLVVGRGIRPRFPRMGNTNPTRISSSPSKSSFDSGNMSDTSSLQSQSSGGEVADFNKLHYEASSAAPNVESAKSKSDNGQDNETVTEQRPHVVRMMPKRRYREKCFHVLKKTVQESWDAQEETRLTASSMHDRVAACLVIDKV